MGKERRRGVVYLYTVTRISTGQTYVGVTINARKRWNTHRWSANAGRSNQLVHRAMAKYGLAAFAHQVVACSSTWSAGVVAEQQLIEQYGSHASRGGYNLTFGGEGPKGRVCSPETKRRMSASKIGRPGRPISDEEKAASSARLRARWKDNPEFFASAASLGGKAQRGRRNSPATKARMSVAAYEVWSARRDRSASASLRVPQHH